MDESSLLPSLIEPSAKHFLSNTLRQCHDYKMKTYSFALNLGILVGFIIIVGGILYYRYKNKPTPYELRQKMLRDQAIVMSKIHSYQDDRKRSNYSDMTQLPFVDSDYYLRKPGS